MQFKIEKCLKKHFLKVSPTLCWDWKREVRPLLSLIACKDVSAPCTIYIMDNFKF